MTKFLGVAILSLYVLPSCFFISMLYLYTLLHISFVSHLSLLEIAAISVYTTTFSVVPRYIHLLVSIKIIIVQPFVTLWSLLWLLLTSYDKLYSMIPHVHKTSPGKNDNLPLVSLPHLL